MEEKIKEQLVEVGKALATHGGGVELVEVVGKVVKVRLLSACGCCPHALATLKGYIEETLKATVDPEIVVERAE